MSFEAVSIILPAAVNLLKVLSSEKVVELSNGDSTIEEINKEIEKKDISLQLAQQQARFAQELAIALRIETADEVEIEEFYDNAGEGNLGIKENEQGLNIGISGNRRRITKRIYKFKGHNGEKTEVYKQKLNEILITESQDYNK